MNDRYKNKGLWSTSEKEGGGGGGRKEKGVIYEIENNINLSLAIWKD